jgi:DNA-binding NtrC family response regulator
MKRVDCKKILLVEDDELFREAINNFLAERYDVTGAESAEAALELLNKAIPELILLDITLPGMDGIAFLKKIKATWPQLPVIMLTAIGRIPQVVESIKLGADNYLTKPIDGDELLLTLERVLETSENKRELEHRRKLQLTDNQEYQIIGSSTAIDKIRKEIHKVGKSDSTVLIEGESGSGKEVVARGIHSCSPRASGPFVALNCGAIPKELMESELFGHKKGAFTGAQRDQLGKFQLAHRGTLVLDEISELPAEAQTKLLRVLDEHEFYPVGSNELVRVDVRIIAATNKHLDEQVSQNLFREDLFFRLNVYSISIPPLRKRPEDIIPLAEHFVTKFNRKFGKCFEEISTEAKAILLKHSWKGNVRELRNVIERIVLSNEGTEIRKEHIFFLEGPTQTLQLEEPLKLPEEGIDLEEVEKKLMLQALQAAKWNKTKAARLLNLTPPTFYYRLEKYGLK